MKAKDAKSWIDTLDPEADIVLAKPFVIDKDEQILGIVDLPVIGMAYNENAVAELRLLVGFDDATKCLLPSDIKFLCSLDTGNEATQSLCDNETALLSMIKRLISIVRKPEGGATINLDEMAFVEKAHELVKRSESLNDGGI